MHTSKWQGPCCRIRIGISKYQVDNILTRTLYYNYLVLTRRFKFFKMQNLLFYLCGCTGQIYFLSFTITLFLKILVSLWTKGSWAKPSTLVHSEANQTHRLKKEQAVIVREKTVRTYIIIHKICFNKPRFWVLLFAVTVIFIIFILTRKQRRDV